MSSNNSELSMVTDAQRKDLLGPQMRKTRLCQFHMQGNCMYGDRCTFAHEMQELQSAPDLRKTRICQAYMMGGCNKEKCNFAHGLQELRSTDLCYKTSLCMWHSKGKCMNGSRCRFAHGHKELRHQREVAEAAQREAAQAEAMALARRNLPVSKPEANRITSDEHPAFQAFAFAKNEEQEAATAAVEKLKAFLQVRADEGLPYDGPMKVETASVAPGFYPAASPDFYKAGKASAAHAPGNIGAMKASCANSDSIDFPDTEDMADAGRLRAWALLQQKIKEADLFQPAADVGTRYSQMRAQENNEVAQMYGMLGHSPAQGTQGGFDVGVPYNGGLDRNADMSNFSLKEISELAKNLSLLSSQASYLDGVVRGMEIGMKTGMGDRKAATWQSGPPGLGSAAFQIAQV